MKAGWRNVNTSLMAILAEGFLSRLSFGLIGFALPLYALRLGMSLLEIGVLISLNAAVALALKPVAGWAADRFGLKRVFTIAMGLRSLVTLLLIFAGAPWHLFAIRVLHGLSEALRDPAVHTLLAEQGGKKTIASTFAWYSTAKSAAGSLAKAAAGILLGLTVSDFSLVFGLACLLSALPLYAVARHVNEPGKTTRPTTTLGEVTSVTPIEETQAPTNGKLRQVILSFIGLGVMIGGTASMLAGLFPILATEYAGLSETETGLIYALSTIVILLSGPLFGWLSDHVSQKLVLLVRSMANTLSSLLYLVVPGFWSLTLGKTVDDMGKAAFRPAWGALMAHVSSFDRRRRAQIIGYMSMAEDIGTLGAPILAGFLWNAYGLPVMLGVRILLAVLTEVYTLALVDLPQQTRDLLTKELNLMNILNRILMVMGLLIALGLTGLAAFVPATLEAGRALFSVNTLPKEIVFMALIMALGGLLALEVWPRPAPSVAVQDGRARLEVASVCRRLTTRLDALEAVHAVKAEVFSRRKGAEVRLRLVTRADVNVPALLEQVNCEVQDEIETQLGVRLLRQRCLILHAVAQPNKPADSPPITRSLPASVGVLANLGE